MNKTERQINAGVNDFLGLRDLVKPILLERTQHQQDRARGQGQFHLGNGGIGFVFEEKAAGAAKTD